MEPLIILVILLLLVAITGLAGAGLYFLISRSRGGGVDLEPPPSTGGVLAPPRPTDTVEAPSVEAPPGVVVDERVLDEPVLVEPEAPVIEAPRRPSLRERLAKARSTFAGFLGRSKIDAETWDELEEALIRADVGVGPATELIEQLRGRVRDEGLETGAELVEALKVEMKARLAGSDRTLRLDEGRTNVWLFVGVNGVGKTTTIGKLGKRQVEAGHHVVMAAGDTFRAAAAEQLETWANRAGADFIRGAEGADPSSIIFDAIESAAAKGGIVFAIHEDLGIPVKLVGLGETAEDLVDFDPDEFVEGLLSV